MGYIIDILLGEISERISEIRGEELTWSEIDSKLFTACWNKANKEKEQKRPTKSATELWENITPDDTEYYKSNINLYPFHNQLLQALKDLGLQCKDWRIMIAAKAMRNVDVYWGVEPSNFVEIAARFS